MIVSAANRAVDRPFSSLCKDLLQMVSGLLQNHLGVTVFPFFDDGWSVDLARLGFADVAICGPSSTFCFWAALVAAWRGKTAHVQAGKLLMNASRPRLPGIAWSRVSTLARIDRGMTSIGQAYQELVAFIVTH